MVEPKHPSRHPVSSAVQVIQDVLREDGIRFKRPGRLEARVGGIISRVWSLLWGWTGHSLVRIRSDVAGNLCVRPPDWDRCTIVHRSATPAAGNWFKLDFGQVVDYVHFWTYSSCGQGMARFSLDDSLYEHYRAVKFGMVDGVNASAWGECYCRCRYFQFYPTDGSVAYSLDALGYVFPKP